MERRKVEPVIGYGLSQQADGDHGEADGNHIQGRTGETLPNVVDLEERVRKPPVARQGVWANKI